MAKARIVIEYTPTGGGFQLDIKCENAHLIGSGKSEYIARKIRKEIHRQRYQPRLTQPEPIVKNVRRTAAK